MLPIQAISTEAKQRMELVLGDGTIVELEIEYKPQQYGWFITSLTYGEVVLKGLRIVTSPNMLYQWRNVLPFGLACFVTGYREPTQLEDFEQNAAQLFLLTQEEMAVLDDYFADD